MKTTLKHIVSIVSAIGLTFGSLAVVTATASAAPPNGCSQTAGVPYKTANGQVAGYGSGSCGSYAQRTFIYQVHRVEGWWHPNVAQNQHSGNLAYYHTTAANCDVGSGSGSWQYFGQAFFRGHSAVLSGNSPHMIICG